MTGEQRRAALLRRLEQAMEAVPAHRLAADFGVSRQSIVGDVALLRAQGVPITATAAGYVLITPADQTEPGYIGTVVCCHDGGRVAEELALIVGLEGRLLDVTVEHPEYGYLTAALPIHNEQEAEAFVSRMDEKRAVLLSSLTGGIHEHRIRAENEAAFQCIKAALAQAGLLLDEAQ